ncbi:differentially expressed in FDCP 8 homolog A-like isoform X4 [Haliotis rufescens]|uniref:differentially expressed in FDCP 8 homolog A-like isoform X3 n=1 Tax=Haliotis rufescens TaxID=6454 RepID=UPI00201EE658|nr:differentially expressed in FDCP 8 homolog A-like isoform X3 [Haliotis rufescens]XP_048241862.1 differentially expressed in FDCP 8 homolog A-like isoform X4 [Haliotis rufescens]
MNRLPPTSVTMASESKVSEKREIIHASESSTATVKISGGRITKFSGFESDSEEEEQINHIDADSPIRNVTLTSKDKIDDHDDHLQTMDIPSSRVYRKRSEAFSESLPDFVSVQGRMGSRFGSRSSEGETPKRHVHENQDRTSESSSSSSPQKDGSFPRERFNPFNKDIHIDDDHFSDSAPNYFHRQGTQSSDSNKSGSGASDTWTDIGGGVMSGTSDTDDVTYADLGLAEDHFSQPEGHFGLSSSEELDLAIENCVELIRLAPHNSDKQKNLIRKLVQLRMKKQELKEGSEPVSPDVKVVVGHKFREKTSRSSKHYCEKCNAVIWGMVQAWYKCIDCGYSCHAKCLILITRTCAKQRVLENPSYCLSICPQKGLASQNYRCAECKSSLSFKSGAAEPRLCDYSGNYYCELCHWNDQMTIPGRVLHNWDFLPRKVCRASKQYLKLMASKAAIRIQDINPMLFNFVEELSEIKKLREEMLVMKKYILLCPSAMKSKLLLLVQTRQHFVESSDIYSMKDLMDIQTDTLLSELAQVHSAWAQHIKTDCELCQARGFFCEMCEEKEVLFPFDNIAVVCSQCSNVIHRHCFDKQGQCPRCQRRDRRKVN